MYHKFQVNFEKIGKRMNGCFHLPEFCVYQEFVHEDKKQVESSLPSENYKTTAEEEVVTT